jgi:predicted DsbA family dithiol-disulfide isomerase
MGLVNELKKEFAIRDEWLGFEIHPETPPEGMLLSDRLPDVDWDGLYRDLRRRSAPLGIAFGDVRLLSNSRTALEAGEYARDQEAFEAFHAAVFRSYFTDAQDIGNTEILLALADQAGLDAVELQKALDEGRYRPRLTAVNREARKYGFSGVPAFIIANRYTIVGAQPIEVFRQTLREAEGVKREA